MQTTFDVVIVGGGIIGLATAWQLARDQPELRLALVEAEPSLGTHQTSHNSGVLHSGIYYPPGSLKAQMCIRGKELLEQFCSENDLAVKHNGKLVVATRESELAELAHLFKRAVANGVRGVRRLEGHQIPNVEPAATGIAAIHSPFTGVVDFRGVAQALAHDLAARGASIRTSWKVTSIGQVKGTVTIRNAQGDALHAKAVVVCAGLQADRLAKDPSHQNRVVPFRGKWFVLDSEIASQVRGSVYPVPDPRLPFLGVHVTRRIDDEVWAGPNAFLALSRQHYRSWAFQTEDAANSLTYPGIWKFAAHNIRAGSIELIHDVSAAAYARTLRRYLPDVRTRHLRRGPMGIRAQVLSRHGELVDDFLIRTDGRVLHLLNAPSPAATSSLAIGEHLCGAVKSLLT